MKQENPLQPDLPAITECAAAVNQANSITDLAALSAKIVEHGLVREHRPVFVFDEKLAKEKTGNAMRQTRLREKRVAQGLVTAQIPLEIAEMLKNVKGDWSKLTQIQVQFQVKEVPVEIIKTVEVIKEVLVEVPVEVIKTVEVIKEVRVEVPGKPVLKLSAEQKKTFLLGKKLQDLTGFKRFLVQKIIGL